MAGKDYNHLFKLLIIGDSSQFILLHFAFSESIFIEPQSDKWLVDNLQVNTSLNYRCRQTHVPEMKTQILGIMTTCYYFVIPGFTFLMMERKCNRHKHV